MSPTSTNTILNGIISVEDAQQYAASSSAENSALLVLAISVISAKIDEFLYGQDFHVISQTYTDVVLGETRRARHLIFPGPLNVTAIASLEQRAGKDQYVEISTAVYELTNYGAWGYGYMFMAGERLYRATWTAGWTLESVPGTIREVAFEEVKQFLRAQPGLMSESTSGAGNIVNSWRDIDPTSKAKLNSYRRVYL